jgi:hypothetical protein
MMTVQSLEGMPVRERSGMHKIRRRYTIDGASEVRTFCGAVNSRP